MNKFPANITDELRACLDSLVGTELGNSLSAVVESLLRQSGPVDAARQQLGLEWQERSSVGWVAGRPRKPRKPIAKKLPKD